MPVEISIGMHQDCRTMLTVCTVKADLPDGYEIRQTLDSLFRDDRSYQIHTLEQMRNAMRDKIDREIVKAFDRVMATVTVQREPPRSRVSLGEEWRRLAVGGELRGAIPGHILTDGIPPQDRWAPDNECPDSHAAYSWVEQMPKAARTIRGEGYTAMMLTTPRSVWNEAKHMQHCIWRNYRNKVARGAHIAFHLEAGSGFTLGLEDPAGAGRWRQVMLSGYENAGAGVFEKSCALDVVERFNAVLSAPATQ